MDLEPAFLDKYANRQIVPVLYARIQALEQALELMKTDFQSIHRRLSQLEFAPPNGPEFLKILDEARAAGDFASEN